MRTIPTLAWLLCPCCLLGGLIVRVVADDDPLDDEKWKAVQKRAQADIIKQQNQVREDTERQIKEVEKKLEDARKWTKAQFEVGERNQIDKPKLMGKLMTSWQSQRDHEKYLFIQFPEKSGGSIESGNALNFMMDTVGAAAYQNSETRKIKPDEALPLCDASMNTKVDRELAEQLICQENILGPKQAFRLNRQALDLDWPAILKEERWQEDRQRFEDAKKKVFEEISGDGLTAKTDEELRESISTLNQEFATYRTEWVQGLHETPGSRAFEYRRICDGAEHIKILVMGAYQLVNLSKYDLQRGTFKGGTIEDFLAYMHRSNLRFAPASPAHRSAYHTVFNMMVRYYLDQKAAVKIEQNLETQLADLRQTDKDAIDRVLDRTMSATDQTALKIEQEKTIQAMFK